MEWLCAEIFHIQNNGFADQCHTTPSNTKYNVRVQYLQDSRPDSHEPWASEFLQEGSKENCCLRIWENLGIKILKTCFKEL